MLLHKLAESLGEFYGNLKCIVIGRYEIVRLAIIEESANRIGRILLIAILLFIGSLVLLMLSLALVGYFYSLLDSFALSFIATAGVLAIFAIVVYLLRYPLIMNPVLRNIFRKSDIKK